MKNFTNQTKQNNEKATKIGTNIPDDAAVLSWFTSEKIIPKNNLVTVSLSETIPENKISESYDAEIMYADELGILRRLNGSSVLSTDDITISNLFLHKPTVSETLDPANINANDFGHYMYISRYFTVAPNLFPFTAFESQLNQDTMYSLGIKVLDDSGKDYIDTNTNRKKYKILLEPYKVESNANAQEIPYRIIIILDSSYPLNLKLMYNKIECDSSGKLSNQQLRYTETINSVKYYNSVPEESFVIDPNYYGSRIFSIKKIDKNYSNLSKANVPISNGYQVITTNKAIKDYRNYEVFNWRLIGKINRNINLQNISYGIDSSPDNPVRLRTVNAGILYSGSTNENINPYVLYRLENSPFNLTKLVFENPLSTTADKASSSYWKVNINSVTSADLSKFDVLLWSPDSVITSNQAALINNFVSNNFGTVILDLTNCPNASNINSGGQLNMVSSTSAQTVDMIDDSILIDATKNGGWTINDTIFEKDYYSVIGSSKINGITPKTYKYFNSAQNSNIFVKVGTNSSTLQSIGILISYPKQNDTLTKGNIIATTFNVMSYCNAIYDVASADRISNTNAAEVHFGTLTNSSTLFSSVVEGPFKLLFNMISYAMYCKALSTIQTSIASSKINFITDWSSSWVMYSDALEQSEKNDFNLISISNSKSVYARNLTQQSSSTNSSVISYFKQQLTKKLPTIQTSLINELSISDIDFYIEVTNPDVNIKDATKITNPNSPDIDIPSSYTLYRLNNSTNLVSSPANNSLYAYTEKYSRSLSRVLGLGPHILLERPVNSSSTKSLINLLSPTSGFNSYPFKLKSNYTMYEGSDIPYGFNFTFNGKATYTINALAKTQTPVKQPGQPVPSQKDVENIKSAIDDYQLNRVEDVSSPSNIFPYTGDIDIHGDPRIWIQGSPKHEYVKYIQYTLSATGLYKGAFDGIYGPVTSSAVKAFQIKYNLRYEDGKVDSETKWHLALVWLTKRLFEGQKVLDDWKAFGGPEISKYISAVENMGLASDINKGKIYRKITFTGTPKGPTMGADTLFFEVPNSVLKVTGITIRPDNSLNGRWNNFRIVGIGWSPTASTNIFEYGSAPRGFTALNISARSGDITIPINSLNPSDCRYMFIMIEGFSASGLGVGEGFGISQIIVNGTVNGEDVTNYVPGEVPVSLGVEVTFNTPINGLFPSVPKIINVKTVDDVSKLSHYISALSFEGRVIPISSNSLQIGSGNYEDSNLKVNSFSFATSSISLSSLSISSVKTTSNVDLGTNAVSFTNSSGTISFDTSAAYYGSSLIKTQAIDLSSNFRLKTTTGSILPSGKNTINYGDGVLLLCDNLGNPIGIPTYSEIKAAIDSSSYASITAQEKDLRYGYFSIYNELSDQGIRYGFYDISEKKFLGNFLNYIDLYSKAGQAFSRNISNIYIAICALDADGQTGDNEFFGLNNSSTFIPSTIPLKYLVPVYSVKYKSNTSIRVGEISDNISKFDIWELPISNGSFNKEIYIDPNIPWHDWKWNYMGQRLIGEYSTLDTPNISWSTIFGNGYYDVIDEIPNIIDSKTIQIKRTPILAWNHPTDNLKSIVGIIKPEIKIYTRESTNDEWSEIDYSIIKDINCHTGVVQFKSKIVPASNSLIKVSYTTENNNLLIRQVAGQPVPLNPMLNSGTVKYNKPLYIYLLPTNVYKYSKYNESLINGIATSNLGYEIVDEYTYANSINFTYDSNLFDKNSKDYNPFALTIAIIYVTNKPSSLPTNVIDLRVRGGGIKSDIDDNEILQTMLKDSSSDNNDILSYWDIYPPQGNAYSNGGYVIIQIPESVKDNFIDSKQIYEIIKSNLTAGIVFDVQDLEGNSWS